jgi:diaminopimelate epimerase
MGSRPFSNRPSPGIPFIKMEGCGNDYVYIDAGLGPGAVDLSAVEPPERWAAAIADRHYGVGGDGLIVLRPGERTPLAMRMWNADGSEGRLCLNGLRCAAKLAAETVATGDAFAVETAAGERRVRVRRDGGGRVVEVEVEAGRPDFRRSAIPARGGADELWGETFRIGGSEWAGYGVSVGNPHVVIWMGEGELGEAPLEAVGRAFESDATFPEGVNVHLAARSAPGSLVMRTWERGSGATLACGTGAVAVFAVARRLGLVGPLAEVAMPGGPVTMREEPDGGLVQVGPAREVFRGLWTP